MYKELYEKGQKVRREVLGDKYVDAAAKTTTDFNRPFQELIAEYVWGTLWSRPGLDRRTRALLAARASAFAHQAQQEQQPPASLPASLPACQPSREPQLACLLTRRTRTPLTRESNARNSFQLERKEWCRSTHSCGSAEHRLAAANAAPRY